MKLIIPFVTIVLAGVIPCRAQNNFSFEPDRKIAGRPYFSDPAISPDGTVIAFASGGDIWTVSAAGGEARLLISHPAYESRPVYSPDGKWLAFNSNRTGNGDVYLFNLATSEVRRLTFDDGNEDISGWSPDSKYVYFSTASHDINAMRDVYRVKTEGGTPMPVSNSRYMTEFWAMPSPDGKEVAFDARGVASSQWWRNGHSHLDESEIWLWKEGAAEPYQRLTEGGAKDLWPMWSKDAATLYFVSDRSGAQNLWSMPVREGKTLGSEGTTRGAGTTGNGAGAAGRRSEGKTAGSGAKQLTSFTKGRVLWPSMAANGQTIVYERDFAIWKYDVNSGKTAMVEIRRVGTPSGGGTERARADQFRDMKLSPDGKKVAFVAHGEVFVSAVTGGEAFRTTFTGANEGQLAWAPNSNAICYVSDRDEVSRIYEYNFITGKETRLTNDIHDDAAPVYSPDGKTLAFIRDTKELRVLDRASGKETLLTKAFMGRPPIGNTSVKWSPDGKWIAFTAYGAKGFRNVNVIPLAGGEAKPISFLANTFGGNISWGEDGRYILFNTRQRTEMGNIARVELAPRRPDFSEDRLQRLFIEQSTSPSTPVNPGEPTYSRTNPATMPADSAARDTARSRMGRRGGGVTRIVFDGIHERLSLLALGGADVNDMSISRDGLILITASVGGQTNLYTYSANESARGEGGAGAGGRGGASPLRPLTTTPGNKSDAQFSPDGKEVFFLSQGAIESISLDTKTVKPIAIRTEMQVDFDKEKVEVFRQAWQAEKKGYADPDMNGVDWNAVYKEYEPLAAGAATSDELRRILSLMVGELNSSHSGVAGGGGPVPATTGRLGLGFDRKEYEEKGKLKITEVVYGGPADLAGIRTGDYLLAVDGKTVTAGDNLDELLENKVGRKVTLRVSGRGETGGHSEAGGSVDAGRGARGEGDAVGGRNLAVKPVNLASEKGLLYRQWVRDEREYVSRISNGRLGYVHMNDMSEESLNQLYLDLDAENQAREGVVVDVRNNNGGFVNAYALDVLTRKSYLTMTNRGLPASPARAQLGQRALELPTILLTNQHSLSDAEDFTEGYRTLGLGKTVGEPTGGWIIFTSSVNLIDGSTVRLPFSKITDHTGKNMELHPRPVDIAVSNPIGEPAGKDAQADAAVKELLREIDAQDRRDGGRRKANN
ncbi:MAG TPA: S41 family peptidase [Puia sp.]